MTARAETVTILFTDLVGSTELLQRAGDEQAQHILKAHHRLLREAVEAHHGHEVKWLGDGLMVAFSSTLDAVACAIAMQQSSRRPTAGERLEIRAGLNVGEVTVDAGDYFGTPVVIARRLCDRAGSGQIFASDMIVRLLDGRGAEIEAKDLGPLELKGITFAVPAVEIVYQHDPMALLRKLPFVGRQAEYETLTNKLVEARSGRGSVVLLAGEPGIGKTRLTEEFCERATLGATVIRGNCYEGDMAAPFGPWLEALRSLIEQIPDADLRDALGPGAPDINVMLPQIQRRLPDIGAAPKLDPESERSRLFESIISFLRNAAQQQPLVIFLDDLHWCDRPSLALIELVARVIADRRIMIVGTYRDVEVDRIHPLAQTLAALRRMEHYERLAIRGFTEDAVYDLLTVIEPSPQAEPARRALAAALRTDEVGNPFFIREVLNHLVETGKLVQHDGVWTGIVTSIEELGIPEGVKEVIGRRLSRLREACNRMLQRASAMTSGFTWDELRAICDDTEEQLLDALDEALGSQIIEERRQGTYAFTHAIIRASLYDELSSPRRVMLHRRIAESLEVLYATDLDSHLGELAAHYLASTGGPAQKAIEYCVRAGDRAKQLVAWEEAASHYRRAVEAMDLAKEVPGGERCRVLLALADCNLFSGLREESVSPLREAAAIARALKSADLFARAANAFEDAAGRVEADLTADRLALLDEALDMLGSEDSALKAWTLASWVRAAAASANARAGISSAGFSAFAGHKDDAIWDRARAAVAMAERVGDELITARTLILLHDYGWTPDNDRERLGLSERALAAACRAHAVFEEQLAYNVRAQDLLALGDIAEFRRNAVDYSAAVEKARLRSDYVAPIQVGLEIAEGKLSVAEQRLEEYSARLTGDVSLAFASIGQRYFLRHMQGRLEEMESLMRVIVERVPGVPFLAAGLASALAQTGKGGEAASQLNRLTEGALSGIPRDFLWRAALNNMAEASAELGAPANARVIYAALSPYASVHAAVTHVMPLGSMARVVGRLATVLERWDEAQQHFDFALEHDEQRGFSAWVACTQLNYGQMLLRRNRSVDADRARRLLTSALAFGRDAGMGKVKADSERLLA